MSFISTEIESIKTWWHTLIDHLFSHPQAATVAPAAIAAVAQASTPLPPEVKPSGNPDQDRLLAAYLSTRTATVVPTTPGVDSTGAQNSTGPLASFDKLWAQGRWTFKAGVAVDVPITAPAGSYRIQMSGSGGQAGEGGDSSAHVSVTVKDGENVLGSGDANATASFTKGDGPVVVTFLSDKDTLQAITLQTGAAVISR